MATTTNPTLKSALEARLAAMKDGRISPYSVVEEKMSELAEALTPYLLEPFDEMRESEVEWRDRVTGGAVIRAMEAAERILIDRLALAWSEAPDTLLAHPESLQLRADRGIHVRETVPA